MIPGLTPDLDPELQELKRIHVGKPLTYTCMKSENRGFIKVKMNTLNPHQSNNAAMTK